MSGEDAPVRAGFVWHRNGRCRPLRGTIAQGRHSPASTASKIRKKGVNKEKAPSMEEAWNLGKASAGLRWPELPVPPHAHLAGPLQRNRPSRPRPRSRHSCNPPSISSFRARQWRPGGMRSSGLISLGAPRGGHRDCGGFCRPAVSGRIARPPAPTRLMCPRRRCSIRPRCPDWFRRARWPTTDRSPDYSRKSRTGPSSAARSANSSIPAFEKRCSRAARQMEKAGRGATDAY